ncbi:MAG: LptA/OstA family protein, partial [Pseudomonadota bacterium]|nr:LptA/OstA family protein [Pseudomonadota bacterium]
MMRLVVIATLFAVMGLLQSAAARDQLSSELPVLMQADEINYDEELKTVVAKGKVEIVQGERTLLADTVSYNQKTDTVSASGNIVLHEPSGEVIFAEFVELTEELKNGVIERIRVLLEDESRFAANSAVRRDGNKTLMKRAVYSPCRLCEENPDAPPLWQLKAERVEHDQEDRKIRYKDVFLEMWGVP